MNKEDWIRVTDTVLVRKDSFYLMAWDKRGEDWIIRLEFLDSSSGDMIDYLIVSHDYEDQFIPILGPRPER